MNLRALSKNTVSSLQNFESKVLGSVTRENNAEA